MESEDCPTSPVELRPCLREKDGMEMTALVTEYADDKESPSLIDETRNPPPLVDEEDGEGWDGSRKACGMLMCVVGSAVAIMVIMSMSNGKNGGETAPPQIHGQTSLMDQKDHGTCIRAPPRPLRWNADYDTADRICCYNRHWAEASGSWTHTAFLSSESAASGEITFYDTVSGKPLFVAPRGRTYDAFIAESRSHGWPSFRDSEVILENVRVLPDGETVSVDGTHLGHNLPDSQGNRYCINLVSVAAQPPVGG